MADLAANINQAISDFGNIKQAIIDKGVDVPDRTKTSEYAGLISNISGAKSSYIQDNLVYCNDLSSSKSTEQVSSVINENLSLSDVLTFEVCFDYNDFYDSSSKGRIWEVLSYLSTNATANILLYGISLYGENVEFFIYQYDIMEWSVLEDSSGIVVPPNEIHTVSCVVNDKISLYKDGVLVSNFEKKNSFTQNSDVWYMFFKSAAGRTDRNTKGTIYSARIYNKALSEEEIKFNYNSDVANYI